MVTNLINYRKKNLKKNENDIYFFPKNTLNRSDSYVYKQTTQFKKMYFIALIMAISKLAN